MAPNMPPVLETPTPEQAAAGKKRNKPVLIGFGIAIVLALGYWAYTVSGL